MKSNGGRAAGILLAGGSGARARLSTNKAYVRIDNAPMISHSLRTFDRSARVVELVLVIRPQDRSLAEQVVAESRLTTPLTVVGGGALAPRQRDLWVGSHLGPHRRRKHRSGGHP